MFYDLQYKRKIDRFREKEKLTNIDENIYDMRNRDFERERKRGREIDKHILQYSQYESERE